jgi:putative SOS response-associated peptidase YedK
MCGRYDLDANNNQLALHFDLNELTLEQVTYDKATFPRYNIPPTSSVITVISDGSNNHPCNMTWGLVPFWIKNMNDRAKMINARAETIIERPSYKNIFRGQRCLIPATGFFEWKRNSDKSKQPFRITLESEEIFAFAGIWDHVTPKNFPENGPVTSCSIVTTSSNRLMKPIHDRMPVILPKDRYSDWLNPNNDNTEDLLDMLRPFDSDLMSYYKVSNLVNSSKNTTSEVLKPLE